MNTPVGSTPETERRRYPRIAIQGRINGTVRPLAVQITLLNLSRGGFLMQTSHQYSTGETHEFQLTMDDNQAIVVRARIAHSIRVTIEHRAMFLYGLEFVDAAGRPDDEAIQSLMSALVEDDQAG